MVLGQTVTVSVDKNSTSRYPKLSDLIFPLKIGFVNQPNDIDNNKEVYLLGFNKDYDDEDSFVGIVTATASSPNGERKKYVVSPPKMTFYTPEIEKSIGFFDNYSHDYIIRSLNQKSCGAVLYTKKNSQILFLLIQSKNSNHIGFPKGHIRYNETEIETAVREIYEETGLDVLIDSAFKSEYEYMVDKEINKKNVYFLASFKSSDKITIQDSEISKYYITSYSEALRLLTHENAKAVLHSAYERILDKYYM